MENKKAIVKAESKALTKVFRTKEPTIDLRVVMPSRTNTIFYVEISADDNSPDTDAKLLRAAAEYVEAHTTNALLSMQLNHVTEDASETLLRLFFEA